MRLTVLGKSPSWQDAGGACSGYLIQEGDTSIVVDIGNGVFGKLRQHIDYVDVDAVAAATAARVSASFTSSGAWPDGNAVATLARCTPEPASAAAATGTMAG